MLEIRVRDSETGEEWWAQARMTPANELVTDGGDTVAEDVVVLHLGEQVPPTQRKQPQEEEA